MLVGQGAGRMAEWMKPGRPWRSATESCEIILPVSGKTLAETASASQTPFETLLGYYQSLIRTKHGGIYDRYLVL